MASPKDPLQLDFYKEIEEIIFRADKETDAKEREALIAGAGKTLERALGAIEEAKDWEHFGAVQQVLAAEAVNGPVSFFRFLPSNFHCEELKKNVPAIRKIRIELTFKRSEKLKKAAERKQKNYLDRHRFIERSIRLILELLDDDGEWPYYDDPKSAAQAYRFIAEAYLTRARLVLPKGSAIPEKKLEALNHAWEWAKKVSDQPSDIKAEIVLEKVRWDKNYSHEDALAFLESYLASPDHVMDCRDRLHWELNDVYQALNPSACDEERFKNFDRQLFDTVDTRIPLLALYKARAALRLKERTVKPYLNDAVNHLKRGNRVLSPAASLWDDTVKTLEDAAADDIYKGQWEEAALQAWELCRETENQFSHILHVRWYWARQRELYALAFRAALNLAAEEPGYEAEMQKAAEIADSHKSRPTVKLLNLERTLEKEELSKLKTQLDQDVQDQFDTFIIKLDEAKKEDSPRRGTASSSSFSDTARPLDRLPEDWTAVHFFVSDANHGHAIVINRTNTKAVPLRIKSVWHSFAEWQAIRRNPGESESSLSVYLEKLCEECGKMLQPILAETPDHLLFIPHGFFHLLPLHAAITGVTPSPEPDRGSRKTCLFEQRQCMYLPSWSLLPKNIFPLKKRGDHLFFAHWDESPSDYRKVIESGNGTVFRGGNVHEKSTPDNILTEIGQHAETLRLLVLYCHAKGDMINPYNGRFQTAGKDLTFHRLRKELSRLDGVRVVLTACETDLVSGGFGPVDEHLSLASAFVEKGAAEVIGTLYKCKSALSADLLLKIGDALEKEDKPLCRVLHDWQTDEINKPAASLFLIAPFRVTGFPAERGEK